MLIPLLLCVALAGQASDKPIERFPVGTYDYFGYVAWGDLGPIRREETEALALMKRGDYASADRRLRAVRKQHPDDLTAMQGLAYCAYKLKRLGPLINEVATEARKNVGVRDPSPPHLVLFYQYVYGLVGQTLEDGDRKTYFNPGNGRTSAGFYFGQLADDPRAFDPRDELVSILYVSEMHVRGDMVATRQACRACLAQHPKFYQMRLFLASAYGYGTLGHWDGNLKPIPVKEDEKERRDLGLKEAETVIRQTPTFTPAYYVAGLYAERIDKEKARRYFTYYVDHAERGTARYEHARQWLDSKMGEAFKEDAEMQDHEYKMGWEPIHP
ncbi:MAG TPA: hypothetical protein VHE55_00270 [Fimbriimonadaceae bacterium]|nr:hypothetical protein [Fimbriimonadaceae bacterium]